MRAGGCPFRTPSRSFVLVFTVILLAVMLTGCGSSTAVKKTPTPTPTWPPIPTATPGPLTLQQAWGNVPVFQLPTDMGNNQDFVVENAATPDGQWLVGVVSPRDFLTNTIRLSYLALYNVRTKAIQRVRALLHPQSQVLGVSIDDHWIAWSEADDQPNFSDWTAFIYNRDTGQVRELAQAFHVNGQATAGPNTPPVVSNNHVIWSEALAPIQQGNDASLQNAVVRIEDLTTGQVTTLATKAGESNLAWPWACWGQITTGGGGYVVFKNLVTGLQEQMQSQPATIALSGNSVAYDDTSSAYLIDDLSKGVNTVQTVATAAVGQGEHIEFVSLNNRLVGWSQQSTQPPVWDRVQKRLVILPVMNGESDSWVGGRLLMWLEPEPAAQAAQDEQKGLDPTPTINVVDTSTLPTTPPGS